MHLVPFLLPRTDYQHLWGPQGNSMYLLCPVSFFFLTEFQNKNRALSYIYIYIYLYTHLHILRSFNRVAEDLLLSAALLTWRRPGGAGSPWEAPGGAVLSQCSEEGGPPTERLGYDRPGQSWPGLSTHLKMRDVPRALKLKPKVLIKKECL